LNYNDGQNKERDAWTKGRKTLLKGKHQKIYSKSSQRSQNEEGKEPVPV
jgi:hypothetical protein